MDKDKKLSTFAGVFTPNILTILGVILFLRAGYVVGNAGLIQALIILGLAHIVSITSSFSLSAIVSNMTTIEGGGNYYLLSRSIGIGNGGAIGIILYLAQTISIALYIIGFSEVLSTLIPALLPFTKIISLIVLLILFIPTIKGADIAAKIQTYILGILGLSILVFIVSAIVKFNPQNLQSNLFPSYLSKNNFWLIFAIFFPAVTGFNQGVSLSGALKNPLKSIPLGTFLAVFVGLIIYGLEMVLLAGSASRELLLNNYNVMNVISYFPIAIILGVFAATISSALGSFMGAPFILQAFSKDKLLPFIDFFAKSDEKTNTPKRAIIFTLLISGICILLADLNTIAPIISMFFLMSYGMTNYATFIESYSKNPSFRPTFKLNHWSLSLIGLIAIGFFMVMINAKIAVVAFLCLFSLKTYFSAKIDNKEFKDAHSGYYFQRIKELLIKLQKQVEEFKNWRPQIILLCGNPQERKPLIEFGKLIEAKKGILSLIQIIESQSDTAWNNKIATNKELEQFIKENNIELIGEVIVVKEFYEGLKTILQSYGFQGIQPNTVLLGWSDKDGKLKKEYLDFIKYAYQFGKSIVLFESKKDLLFDQEKTIVIDIWWRGQSNGALMLMFAHLINLELSNINIRILRIVPDKASITSATTQLKKVTNLARIKSNVVVIEQKKQQNIQNIIIEHSKESDFVFLGLSWEEKEIDFLEKYKSYRKAFKNLALIKSHEELGLLE